MALILLGVLTRLAFLLAAGELDPYADESNYLYFALCWERFSFYSGGGVFLWPPGYIFFLSIFLRLFQADGVFAAKLCQVLLSGVIGGFTMLFAARLFNRRAALLAGVIWVVHLQFIAFTHYIWPEPVFLSVFLPGLYLLYTWWRAAEQSRGGPGRLLLAGLLLGVALLTKEALLYFVLLLALLLVWRLRRVSWPLAGSRATLFLLAVIVVVLPWSLRNYEVYGRVVPVGSTLGENCYQGILRSYKCFDYPRLDYEQLYDQQGWLYRWFIARPEGSEVDRLNVVNVIDRSATHVAEARRLAWEHPGWFARSRIKRVANWAAPMSYFIRHYSLERYHGVLNAKHVRNALIVLCLVQCALVVSLAIPGFFLALREPVARTMLAGMLIYFMATAVLVGMSRHRVTVEPLLIVLAAGFLAGGGRPWLTRPLALAATAGGGVILAFLWYLNYPELSAFVRMIW